MPGMHRRSLLKGGLAAASLGAVSPLALGQDPSPRQGAGRFKLKYAPHFGMFRNHAGNDLADQLKFMHDEGFEAFEDNGLAKRSEADQAIIGQTLRDLGMTMGVFVIHGGSGGPTLASRDPEVWRGIEGDLKRGIKVLEHVDAKWCTVVPGTYHKKEEMGFQRATAIDNLRRAADILAPAKLTAVLEPLNPYVDHPGLFLTEIPQAFAICRAVNSPFIKILDDLYHQQVTEGNLIRNIDRAWSEIAYFQVGDNPGRKEPTTGEINYRNIFRHLHQKGWEGVIGMEHGNSRGGKE
ncbi:MAG: hydroxypyruvate isomerase, partial [Gammaproteobacteria bacterium]